MCPDPSVPAGTHVVVEDPVLEVTGQVQREAWYAKTFPPVEQVRDSVWSVPVVVPDNPIRYTSSYLLFGDGELVVVDPGWDTEDGWTALEDGLRTAGSAISAVTGIVITHTHPDHHGMAKRLAAASGAWIAMHGAERDGLPNHAYPEGTVSSGDLEWLAVQGVPVDQSDLMRMTDDSIAMFRRMAEPTVILADGEPLPLAGRNIRAIWTPGHTPGHLCLHDEDNNVILTGDHILPRISPNVGMQPRNAAPPLASYLASLHKIAALDSAEVLPAHEWRFRGLATRTRQLIAHHGERLDEIIAVVGDLGQCSAWQVTEKLTWSRGWAAVTGFQRRAALAETIAHLAYLVEMGRLTVIDGNRSGASSEQPGRAALYSLVG